jgi:hypothetical protein
MSTTSATATLAAGRSPGAQRRRWLLADAAVSGASGLVLLVGAAGLDSVLGPRPAVLAGLGVFFLVFAASLTAVVRLGAPVPAVRVIGVGNLAWAGLSVGVAVADVLPLTTAGVVVAVAQAAAVAVLGDLQLWSARRR